MINSFLSEHSQTLNSWERITAWKTEAREGLQEFQAQGLPLTSLQSNVSAVSGGVITCGHGLSIQQADPRYCHRSDTKIPAREETKQQQDGAASEIPVDVRRLAAFL